jgi:hypothetical protein
MNIYPKNANKDEVASYCVTEIFGWEDALPQFKDKQFSVLRRDQ